MSYEKDFAYTAEGEVVLFGNTGNPPLLNGKFIYPDDVPWGVRDKHFYSVVDGVLTPMTAEEKANTEAAREKTEAYEMKLEAIDTQNSEENLKDFTYDGSVFTSDQPSIQATQNQCLTMDPADPIPTPGGAWVLANDQTRAFTVAQFIEFATAFFMRGSNNYGVKTFHKTNLRALYNDESKGASDILGYDHSVGWN